MENTIDALKNLCSSLGAEADDTSDLTTIPELINAAAKQITLNAQQTELPSVSATDNGKVLKVIDGEWAVGTDNVTVG